MDTDSDSWSFQIGDVDAELTALLKRDSEIRVSLFALTNTFEPLHTGFTDEISMSEDGTIVLSGRDITAPAVDSIAEPGKWKWVRPDQLVAKQARMLRIGDRLHLDKAPAQKNIYTDGSETYWEFWYRFYRKRAAWIWGEPDGVIRAGKLNYDQAPIYKFGSAAGMKSSVSRQNWIPVEALTFTKTTQKRLGEVLLIGHRGTIPFISQASDPTTDDWIKRPRKIIDDNTVKSKAEATKQLWEEIYESKVGSIEISLTVWNPGFIIRQNRMATVNIPQVGLRGTYFVVGSKIVASGSGGVWQEIRLREKGYAISRRVPDDPKLAEDPGQGAISSLGANLGLPRQNWGDYFIQATQKFKEAWDFNLFCAVLLAICDQETGFRNVREGGDTEWYAQPKTGTEIGDNVAATIAGMPVHGIRDATPAEIQAQVVIWEGLFANKEGNPKNPFGREAGVGPMQLTTAGYKDWADEMANKKSEYAGGRWQPKFNIYAAARALAGKLAGLPPSDNNIWEGVRRYNGAGSAAYKYMRSVKQKAETVYLPSVKAARLAASQAATNAKADIPDTPKGLAKEVLDDPNIIYNFDSSFAKKEKNDIQSGQIADAVLTGLLILSKNVNYVYAYGYYLNAIAPHIQITALKSDHDTLTTEGRVSAHSTGHAVDLGGYTPANATGPMMWMKKNRELLGFRQMIGPNENLVINVVDGKVLQGSSAGYDSKTLGEHKNHIHLGY